MSAMTSIKGQVSVLNGGPTSGKNKSATDETLTRIDQAMDHLEMLESTLDPSGVSGHELASSTLSLPVKNAFEENWLTCLPGPTTKFPSPDGRRFYVASELSNWLIGFHTNAKTRQTEEFYRLKLGLQTGGISSVAVGGTWVFAACGAANRVVVLRLCHDWYQNRTRLLVMRVVDGGSNPVSVACNAAGDLVCVLYSGESLIRVYQCSLNGQLEPIGQRRVRANAKSLSIHESDGFLRIRRDVGSSRIKLESIFENLHQLDMVPA
jgi:hypothetical protein